MITTRNLGLWHIKNASLGMAVTSLSSMTVLTMAVSSVSSICAFGLVNETNMYLRPIPKFAVLMVESTRTALLLARSTAFIPSLSMITSFRLVLDLEALLRQLHSEFVDPSRCVPEENTFTNLKLSPTIILKTHFGKSHLPMELLLHREGNIPHPRPHTLPLAAFRRTIATN